MYRMLLVEDEETIREGLRMLIRQVSDEFEVRWAASHGKEAMRILESDVPDAVIADIRMREMDGLTLTANIKKRYPGMPIVIVSGHSDFEYAHQALQMGVVDYLLKPVQRTALMQALDRVKRALRKPGETERDEEERTSAEGNASDSHRLIGKIKSYIRSHPDGDLRLQSLADIVHLNPAYLSNLFKSVTGSTLTEYVTEVRIEKARHLLLNTGLKVYDVARLSGYQSPKHFMLVFKERAGCTPSDYRTLHGADPESSS